MVRIKSELLSVGLDVETERRPARDPRDWRAALERLSHERRLDAIVDVIGENPAIVVEIWAFEPSLQAFASWRVDADPSATSVPAYLAIRAVEVIRSNLVERGLWTGEPSPDSGRTVMPHPAVPSVAVPIASEPGARLALEAGAALLTSWEGGHPALLPIVRIDWALSAPLVAHATAAGWGTRPTVANDAGSARVEQVFGLAGLRYGSVRASSLQPFVGLGLGVLRTSLEGRAVAPERTHDVAQTSLLVEGSVGLIWRLSDAYFVLLALHAQLAAPYVAIHLGDTVVATTGRPNGTLSLTLGAWL